MGKIVELFKKDDDYIWQCDCGGISFYLYKDGNVKCSECGNETNIMNIYSDDD